VVARRSEALDRFLRAYSKLARLPPPVLAPVDVEAWVRRAVALERRAPVEVVAGPSVTVQADADQLDQVLINLLKNAVEASPAGGSVEIRVHVPPEEADRCVEFMIRDSGPGLDPDARARLFEPFFTKGKSNGTGLGLYVSHGIVQRHGGEIHATSPEEGGAVFTLVLPLHSFDVTESPS